MVRSSSRGPVTLVLGYTLNYGQLTFILASALNYLSILSLFLLQIQNYLNNCRIFQKISPLQIVSFTFFILPPSRNEQAEESVVCSYFPLLYRVPNKALLAKKKKISNF